MMRAPFEEDFETAVRGVAPGQVGFHRHVDKDGRIRLEITRCTLDGAAGNSEDDIVIQLSINHERNIDLFIDSHDGLLECDSHDPDDRRMILEVLNATLSTGYEELVGTRLGKTYKLAFRLSNQGPTIWTCGLWTWASSFRKRWISVPPAAPRRV